VRVAPPQISFLVTIQPLLLNFNRSCSLPIPPHSPYCFWVFASSRLVISRLEIAPRGVTFFARPFYGCWRNVAPKESNVGSRSHFFPKTARRTPFHCASSAHAPHHPPPPPPLPAPTIRTSSEVLPSPHPTPQFTLQASHRRLSGELYNTNPLSSVSHPMPTWVSPQRGLLYPSLC